MQIGNNYNINFESTAKSGAIHSKSQNTVNQQNLQIQKNMQIPSFGAYKPLTEEQKCKKMLLDAKNENGRIRFVTKDEITEMMQAIKSFKTKLSKSELLKLILTDPNEVSKVSDMDAKNITTYFKALSGKSKDIQYFVADNMSGSVSDNAQKELELFTPDKLSDSVLAYIEKNMTGNKNTKGEKFSFLLSYFAKCPALIKHRSKLVEKLNYADKNKTVFENIQSLVAQYNDMYGVKPLVNLLSLMTPDNVEEISGITERLCRISCGTANQFLSRLNKDNFEFACEAAHNESIASVSEDLKYIREYNIELPKLSDYRDGNEYCQRVSTLIDKALEKDTGDDDET